MVSPAIKLFILLFITAIVWSRYQQVWKTSIAHSIGLSEWNEIYFHSDTFSIYKNVFLYFYLIKDVKNKQPIKYIWMEIKKLRRIFIISKFRIDFEIHVNISFQHCFFLLRNIFFVLEQCSNVDGTNWECLFRK